MRVSSTRDARDADDGWVVVQMDRSTRREATLSTTFATVCELMRTLWQHTCTSLERPPSPIK